MDDGRIVGLVSAGIKVEEISKRAQEQLTALTGVASGALLLGAVGTYVINQRLRRHTHGMNADELSRMHDYHQAALHAVREGLLMLDGQYRVALINDGGRELLGVRGDVVGASVADLGLPSQLTGALLASEPRVDEVHLAAERVLVVNTSPVSGGERQGHGGDAAGRDGASVADGRAELGAGFHTGVAVPGARGGEPAAHGRLADRAGTGRGGRGVRDGGAGAGAGPYRPGGGGGERAGAGGSAAGQDGAGRRAGSGAGGVGRTADWTTDCCRRRCPPGTW
ncbi:hypothetical protein STENM327S_08534 [Streptomyces tendae]